MNSMIDEFLIEKHFPGHQPDRTPGRVSEGRHASLHEPRQQRPRKCRG